MSDPTPVCPVGAVLGEGPVWHDARLWFVDIRGRSIHRFDPARRALDSWTAPGKPGWILPAQDGGWLVGLPGAIHAFDPKSGDFTPLATLEADLPGNRLNDATVAPDGTLWFGTMDDAGSAATGRVYSMTARGIEDGGLPPVAITNGPAISPDGALLYHVDTLGRTIWKVPIVAGGALGAPERFITIEDDAGYPDGVTTDAAGNLWVGLYAGWAARCYGPDGTLQHTVRFPVEHITKIAFAGDDLRTAYATTARQGLDAAALEKQPNAGDLFAFRVDTPGLPTTPIALTQLLDRAPPQ